MSFCLFFFWTFRHFVNRRGCLFFCCCLKSSFQLVRHLNIAHVKYWCLFNFFTDFQSFNDVNGILLLVFVPKSFLRYFTVSMKSWNIKKKNYILSTRSKLVQRITKENVDLVQTTKRIQFKFLHIYFIFVLFSFVSVCVRVCLQH